MYLSIKLDTFKSEVPIVYIEGSQVHTLKKVLYFFSELDFV